MATSAHGYWKLYRETYKQLEYIAPYTALVHAKTYIGGGVWYTLDLDYDAIFGILRESTVVEDGLRWSMRGKKNTI